MALQGPFCDESEVSRRLNARDGESSRRTVYYWSDQDRDAAANDGALPKLGSPYPGAPPTSTLRCTEISARGIPKFSNLSLVTVTYETPEGQNFTPPPPHSPTGAIVVSRIEYGVSTLQGRRNVDLDGAIIGANREGCEYPIGGITLSASITCPPSALSSRLSKWIACAKRLNKTPFLGGEARSIFYHGFNGSYDPTAELHSITHQWEYRPSQGVPNAGPETGWPRVSGWDFVWATVNVATGEPDLPAYSSRVIESADFSSAFL